MIEKRRVRFSSIDGIARADLPLACEIWREDIFRSTWAERPILKLAVQFTRYICNPDPAAVVLREIESHYQLGRDEVLRSLTQMRTYGIVDQFCIVDEDVRVALCLSLRQRLRVLQARARFEALVGGLPQDKSEALDWAEPRLEEVLAVD